VEFRRLHPDPATVELLALLAELRLAERASDERPYVIANFVASVDGRATLGGRSGPLGDDGDHEMFHGLREKVDAVLAGTGTLRAERYGRLVRTPERVQRRLAHGLAPTPLMCIITRTGAVPADIPLLADPESHVVVYAGAPVEINAEADVEVVYVDRAKLTPLTVLRRLRADRGVRSVLCEGGPTLLERSSTPRWSTSSSSPSHRSSPAAAPDPRSPSAQSSWNRPSSPWPGCSSAPARCSCVTGWDDPVNRSVPRLRNCFVCRNL
jgi:riboflavin biosynthesis pyrimidine reductase